MQQKYWNSFTYQTFIDFWHLTTVSDNIWQHLTTVSKINCYNNEYSFRPVSERTLKASHSSGVTLLTNPAEHISFYDSGPFVDEGEQAQRPRRNRPTLSKKPKLYCTHIWTVGTISSWFMVSVNINEVRM